MYKKWFDSVSNNFGKGYSKLLNHWKVTNAEEYETFINSFVTAYNYVAQKYQYEIISLSQSN